MAKRSAALGEVFLSAPLEKDGWDNALRELARQTGSARAQLIAFGGAHTIPFNWMTDPIEGCTEEAVAIGGGSADVNWRVACAGLPFEVASEADYDSARKRLKSEVYDEFAERFEMPNGCQTVLLREAGAFLGLSTLRTHADGWTTAAQRLIFADAAPYALAAARMQQAMEHQGARLIAGALEAMNAAAFICDRRGQVGALTAAAEALLSARRGLRLDRGMLFARRSDEDREFQRALGHALRADGGTADARLWLRGKDGPLSGQICEIFSLPQREWSFGFEPRLLVILREPADLGEPHHRMLAQILGLSPAEAEVSLLAAQGVAREEIAHRRGAATATVNAQMKSIFRKCEVSREGQLVALINKLLRR
ncbi:helix-turn-helix transcriptional regulator [Sphingomonas cavernae]|uniref:helix-turn-helix transcriptional regulator n=1 Tax=Sphingomonas cavernae TaxID=2320861 RepID=UPI0015FEBADF|nr:LuxR C-terminal-related transcriptional regulator [Sphingomonas cavernae]